MNELYTVIGRKDPTYLLADPQGADLIGIPCEPGNGSLTMGTIMYRKTSGMWAPATTSQLSTSYSLVVLAEDIDTDANMLIAEDAAAYRAGRLLAGKVKTKANDTLTAAYKLVLRMEGIVLDQKDDAAEFDNLRRKITYKANNSVTPAEADYIAYADDGSTYTVLGNDTTGFTAPESKSFSKWNTKADGTGTDYAAAASYTASGDLTLYAVWA